jgi:hypothetical protein
MRREATATRPPSSRESGRIAHTGPSMAGQTRRRRRSSSTAHQHILHVALESTNKHVQNMVATESHSRPADHARPKKDRLADPRRAKHIVIVGAEQCSKHADTRCMPYFARTVSCVHAQTHTPSHIPTNAFKYHQALSHSITNTQTHTNAFTHTITHHHTIIHYHTHTHTPEGKEYLSGPTVMVMSSWL